MKVTLTNSTPNPEAFIAYIARVSNPMNQSNPDYAKLIKYLLKNGHYSPFEHSYFTFEIVTSRAIAAQMLRHVSFRFQEYSQRYSVAESTEPVEIRRQATKNRQSSDELFDPDFDFGYAQEKASDLITRAVNSARWTYDRLIESGVAKEVARFILPLSTQTTLYMTGSVRSWIHYLALRNDEHTQKEHRLIAQEIEWELRKQLPIVFTALDSIAADKARDEKLLTVLRNREITDAEFLELLLISGEKYEDLATS